jgi:hypothetical protein
MGVHSLDDWRAALSPGEVERVGEGRINHPKRSDSPVRNRIIDECQRIETGVDGLARTSLRFSSQGGP